MKYPPNFPPPKILIAAIGGVLLLSLAGSAIFAAMREGEDSAISWWRDEPEAPAPPAEPQLDKEAYDRKMLQLANLPEPEPVPTPAEGEPAPAPAPEKPTLWPVKAAYPNHGAILPFHRIIAYYGNFYAKGMGVLGEYPEETMLEMFRKEITKWEKADPTTPVMPAVDYIAITAQLAPGKDGMYRARMPHDQIEKALGIAAKLDGIVIVEVQPGMAPLLDEIKSLEPYLKHDKVHLAIDPEFVMITTGMRPGTRVGTVDATDINEAAEYLAELVRANDLSPKVLIVHRYTRAMVTNADKIVPLPEVQILIDMDGWGPGDRKFSTYNAYIAPEPVQFTGFKLFYKNDIKRPGSRLLTPAEVLELSPQPSFIQFQ